MRVMVLGSELLIQRLTISLAVEGIDVQGFSETQKALALLNQDRFDAVVIDSQMEEAPVMCRLISQLGHTPVALIIKEVGADWKSLRSMDADGFIREGATQTEMAARLRAISRRSSPAS